MGRPRIVRKLSIEPAVLEHAEDAAVIQFRDEWGKIVQRFDPALFGMPADIAAALARAFRDHDAPSMPSTRESRWFGLRKLGRFLREDGKVRCAGDLDAAAIRRFIAWLAQPINGRRRTIRSQHAQVSLVRPVLNRANCDNPKLFAPDFSVPDNPVPNARAQRLPRHRLTPAQMRSILAACYAEIDVAWEKFQHGQTIIALPEMPPRCSRGEGRDRWIWRLHRAYGGIAPGGPGMRELGLNPHSLPKPHKLNGFEGYLHITTTTLAAFYIALLIQTAANPGPLRCMTRSCLVPHPLDQHRVMVEWTKPRAGAKLKRLQRRSFDNRRPHAAPRLIEKLLAMTAPLVVHADPSERECLFLHRYLMTRGKQERAHDTGLINKATLRSAMLRFRQRQNVAIAAWNETHPDRQRPPLPNFSPQLIRSSMASAHYIDSQGDILAAKAVLNHASVVTTDIYVDGDAVRRLERDTIARLQSLMIAWVAGETSSHHRQDVHAGANARATALFGHDCIHPTSSAHGKPGRACPKFGGCLACPGLIVPIDPEHLGRIVQATRHLEAARERIDPIRFALRK